MSAKKRDRKTICVELPKPLGLDKIGEAPIIEVLTDGHPEFHPYRLGGPVDDPDGSLFALVRVGYRYSAKQASTSIFRLSREGAILLRDLLTEAIELHEEPRTCLATEFSRPNQPNEGWTGPDDGGWWWASRPAGSHRCG